MQREGNIVTGMFWGTLISAVLWLLIIWSVKTLFM